MARHLTIIQGGRTFSEAQEVAGIRMYRPYSIGDLNVGDVVYHDVRFNWYCVDRDEPVAAYEDVISNYGALEGPQRRMMETEINRCLLADEVDDLRWYLWHRYSLDLVAERVPLPLRETSHLSAENLNVVYDFLQLTENTGYSLLFKVWGYYSTLRCLTSPSLESGVEFLLKALHLLRPGSVAREAELEKVVKRLYQEEGLYVERSPKVVQTG